MTSVLPLRAASTPRESTGSRTHVRLEMTRRGRLLLAVAAFVAGIAVALAAVLMFGVPSAVAGSDESLSTVTVSAGDTLWDYAEQYAAPDADRQSFVHETRALNGMATPRLTEGQQIILPEGAGPVR